MKRYVKAIIGPFFLMVCLLSLAGPQLNAQGGATISTVIGGNVGDGRRATEALVNRPTDVIVDREGNIYFAEEFYDRVRRVDARTGIITTVAGNGVSGFSGDGGPATAASLDRPEGIALDASGHLYIADFGNHRVRRVNMQTGIITTVAGNGTPPRNPRDPAGDGGLATMANLNNPIGLAFDATGNLYIGDFNDYRVRKVNAMTGMISTFAGDGNVRDFDPLYVGQATRTPVNPAGLAFDAMGNLYIADLRAHLIRKVDPAGMLSTIAGDGFRVECDLRGNPCTCFVAGNGRFQNGLTTVPDERGPARQVSLNYPQDVVVDATGIVYIADTQNQRIRQLTPDGMISTVAGGGEWDLVTGVIGNFDGENRKAAKDARFRRPTGIAMDSTGNVLVADFENDRVRRIDTMVMIATVAGGLNSFGDGGLATESGIYVSQAVATDAEGNIYIGEAATGRIRQVDARDGRISTVAGNGTVGFSGDGGPATQASIGGVAGLAVDSKGNIYISELLGYVEDPSLPNSPFVGHRVRRVERATGMISTYAGGRPRADSLGDGGPATQAVLKFPAGLAVDANDNLYIADSCNQRIRQVDARTRIITTIAGNGSSESPSDPCNPNDPCKGAFAGDGGDAKQASLWRPLDVAVDRSGNLIIADTRNVRIRMVEAATGKINTIAGDGTVGDRDERATRARFVFPAAVAVDTAGNIYIADGQRTNKLKKLDKASGRVVTIGGTGEIGFFGDGGPASTAKFRGPTDMAMLPDGSFVFTDTFNHRVRKVK
jgi:sugar lactone lactonase YvrE